MALIKENKRSDLEGEMFLKKMDEKGFTLVELLVVVVIIGILASLAVFALGDSVEEARKAQVKADLRTLNAALELYMVENNKTPDKLNDLYEYLREIPKPPGNYKYVLDSDKKKVISDPSIIDEESKE